MTLSTFHHSFGAIQRQPPAADKTRNHPPPHLTPLKELHTDSLSTANKNRNPQTSQGITQQTSSPLRTLSDTLLPPPNLNHSNELQRDNFYTAKTTSPQWTQPEITHKPHPSQGASQRELLNCLYYKKFHHTTHKKLCRDDLSSTYINRDPPHFTPHKKLHRDNLSTTNTPK